MSVATTVQWYAAPIGAAFKGEINVDTDVFKMLLTNAYTFNGTAHTNYAHVSGDEIDDGGAVTGYTSGGEVVGSVDIVLVGSTWQLQGDAVVWSGLDYSGGVDGAVLYDETADVLMFYLEPAVTQTGSGDFEIDPNSGRYGIAGAV